MRNSKTYKLVISGLMIALAMVLPFLTGNVPQIGNKLLPMHIPALLTGYLAGPFYGLAAGFIMPLMRSIIIGMPPMMPQAVGMAFELATYGFVTGTLFKTLKRSTFNTYFSLIIAMVMGRAVWGAVSYFLYGIKNSAFTMEMFMAGAFLNAIPGIVIQLILIPPLIALFKKARIL